MEKEFIPYEQSLALKELGFDEPCIYYVDKDNNSYIYNFQTHPDEFIEWCGVNVIPTPTFSQAFKWFRENHSLFPYVEYFLEEKFDYVIVSKMYDKPIDYLDGKFDTYEEAELACLKKLIEIVKEK